MNYKLMANGNDGKSTSYDSQYALRHERGTLAPERVTCHNGAFTISNH
jgi:hypothetical protein